MHFTLITRHLPTVQSVNKLLNCFETDSAALRACVQENASKSILHSGTWYVHIPVAFGVDVDS